MRQISTTKIIETVSQLCIKANTTIGGDVLGALEKAHLSESKPLGKYVTRTLIDNVNIAAKDNVPICQDTGMAVIFVDIGQDVHIVDGLLEDAINQGVRQGYKDGYLRKSVVKDPINRVNTGDNTPAIIHYNIISGNKLKITVMPKGFGSENMSRLAMLTPSQGLDGIKDFVIETVEIAGPNPCPPIIVGVGVGGTTEKAALLSKKVLLRDLGDSNTDPFWDSVEKDLLAKINKLNIGPSGFGGENTALGVKISVFPTHIAGLPVAVNICCHASRHIQAVI